ncbi:hypothetical protein DCC81_11865 [Chitinophaga parva]|uniref:Uncharacterized protein n=1 Tax=Chitinophaga parva TaxID=2169414 RepID=A0A2T7BFK6_9BACT|nr:hypothetical protein [Chitinophaga parva]PUZ25003.1 hypothetical protein DCC81_11865 [Chitinophaga parva]
MESLITTLVTTLVGLLVTGFAYLSYKHPPICRKVSLIFANVTLPIMLGIVFYYRGHVDALMQCQSIIPLAENKKFLDIIISDRQVVSYLGLAFVLDVIIVVVFFFLSYLFQDMHAEKIKNANDDPPGRSNGAEN